ncbi:TetR family transcriptional regulator [Micromonospora pisi]|uniref:TetR family transcriptional regulator n=1 Tax=Micromonospora pisi TaxID=589240 RepID=A0A495JBA1_9ACTN|nr:TetR/AcrR family transcriptional regulator [Micromonospora pisi]RKR86207.1 TetR family transcriptional regulator [Micromonospora pisi]
MTDTAVAGPVVQQRLPRQRADASRNYERIVTAAAQLFLERGADVPLDEIAQRAGVGNATLYRHFANRNELIRVVVLSLMSCLSAQAEQIGATEPDAFEALRRFAHASADLLIGGLCAVFSDRLDLADPELCEAREQMEDAFELMLRRARESGQLRPDIGVGDLIVPIVQLTRPLPGTAQATVEPYAHRHLELLLDGLRAPQRSVLPGSAATLADLRLSAHRLNDEPCTTPNGKPVH